MQTRELDDLARREIVDAGVAKAVVLGFAVRTSAGQHRALGCAGETPDGLTDPDTVFDLASVTKPFSAAVFASLVERGVLRHDTPLGALLPESRGTSVEHTALELLLSHRAGFLPHQPLFRPLFELRPFVRGEALRAAIAARVESNGGDFPAVYSDLGYLLAGVAMERATGTPLDELVREHVAEPLHLDVASARQWLRAGVGFPRRAAPTEVVPARGGLVRGVVHDENAWAFAGHGLAGHAGLFGTIRDVLDFGVALLDALDRRPNGWLGASAIDPLVRPRPLGSLRLGFDGKSSDESAAGRSASGDTFGHLGFTGTSFWCDPRMRVVTAMLTNRVCPTRENVRIRAARPIVHEALFQIALRVSRSALAGQPTP